MHPDSSSSFSYSSYGLNIISDIDLHEEVSSLNTENVVIRLHSFDQSDLDREFEDASVFDRPGCILRMSANRTCCTWAKLGTTVVRNGNEILIDPLPGVSEADFVPIVTGALLGNLLHQRGLFVLHGSSLVINGKAVAFLGDKGAGKSTLAAHLLEKGHHVLSDDLVPLAFQNGVATTYPGFSRIKLWPDSVESIGINPDNLPRVSRFLEKRSYDFKADRPQGAVRLEKIYILKIDDEMSIRPCSSREAFIELARHTYLNRYLDATDSTSENFKQCEIVTKSIPILSLNRPHDFEQISRIPDLIENDLDSCGERDQTAS